MPHACVACVVPLPVLRLKCAGVAPCVVVNVPRRVVQHSAR